MIKLLKSCLSAILKDEIKKFDFSKHFYYKKMTIDEMITFDDNLDTNIELNNREIFDLVTEKEIKEKEEAKDNAPKVIFIF